MGVDAGGIAHFTGGPDAEVVVVAVLPYKLGLEYAVRAANEERRCAAAVNNGRLEGVCLPLLDGEGAGRVAADRALLDVAVKLEDAPFNVTVMVDSPMAAPFSWKL